MSNGKKLERLLILPPMAIARFGSSSSPMDAYEVGLPFKDGKPTSDYRVIAPAETLIVDEATGAVARAEVPAVVRFRDADGRIRPVSPFLEVWAQFAGSDDLVPLTLQHLTDLGRTPADLVWHVRAANLKVFRRTGMPRDQVVSDTDAFSDHELHALQGHCRNFKPGKSISFGTMRVIRPTAEFPEIRVRFTPGKGHVFGPRAGDPLVNGDVYAGASSDGLPPGDWPGRWDRYFTGDRAAPPVTAPADIFQGTDIGLEDASKLSSGYLDDSCDGIVQVTLTVGADTFTAHGRFASAVPDFAPDSLPVRSIADDIEQMALGPAVTRPTDADGLKAIADDVQDILRRALDTQRQMNTVPLNGNNPVADVLRFFNSMPGQQTGYGRAFEPIFDDPSYQRALSIHKLFLEAALNAPTVDTAFASGYARVRQPEEVVNLENDKRKLMPAMMRGNEGLELALTRRQIAKLRLADPTPPPAGAAGAALAAPAGKLDASRLNPPVRQRIRPPRES